MEGAIEIVARFEGPDDDLQEDEEEKDLVHGPCATYKFDRACKSVHGDIGFAEIWSWDLWREHQRRANQGHLRKLIH